MGEDYSNLQKMYQQRFSQGQTNQDLKPNNPMRGPQLKSGCGIVVFLAVGIFVAAGIALFLFLNKGSFDSVKEKFEEITTEESEGPVKKVNSKNSLAGTLTNALILPGKDGKQRLYLMTYELKGTNYTYNTYIYEPYEKEIIKYTGIKSSAYPPPTNLVYAKGEIWKINNESGPNKPGVFTYNPETGEETMDTQGFTARFAELNDGISKIYFYPTPPRMNIETTDGRKVLYDITNDALYPGDTEFRNTFKDKKNPITVFALGVENANESARKRLFLVTGPESSLWGRNVEEYYFTSSSTLKFMLNAESKVIAKGKVFLEGVMLYQDDEACFIFHQDKAGNNAERIISCIDKSGNILWTVSTESELSSKLRASDENSLSSMFFIKNNVHLTRSGNLVLFYYDKTGFIGFDFSTGKILFEDDLKTD